MNPGGFLRPDVSGLPGRDLAAPEINPRGYQLLTHARECAEAEIRELTPFTQRRFDGERYIEPDAEALAGVEWRQTVKQLCDFFLEDRAFCAAITARLAKTRKT
jgi:hypothetical protein